MRGPLIVLLLLSLTAGVVFAAGAEVGIPDKTDIPIPPQGWPDWLVLFLGAVLPFIFQFLFSKLPTAIKAPICYGVGGGIGLIIGFTVLGWKNYFDVLRNLGYLWACMSFVYGLMVKPIAKSLVTKRVAGYGGDSTLAKAFAPDKQKVA